MRDIIVEFGINAGRVWKALNSWGSRTESQLIENTSLSAKEVHAAIGWLARENKIYKDGKLFKLGETNLTVKVGENVGKIWYMLHTQGGADILHISRLAQMDERDTYSALGWLAREGKINTKASERNDEVRLAKLEIEGMKGELESLHADLGARNHIIKEMTTQLTERQTQFVENMSAVERLQMELEQNQTVMGKRNDEVRLAKLEIEGMKGELESLHADLGARNHIIKEMTTQLTERQTQFVENMSAVERLQMELEQNQDKMTEMKIELNKKTDDLLRLQNELGTDFLNPEFSTSTLFSKDIPLTQLQKQQNVSELSEDHHGKENFSRKDKPRRKCGEMDISHDVANNSKTKTLDDDESE